MPYRSRIVGLLFLLVELSCGGKKDSVFVIDSTFIQWSEERKLQWTDFKDKPCENCPHAAKSTLKYYFKPSRIGDTTTIYATINFSTNTSYVKEKLSSPTSSKHLLDHEQRHFDLAEASLRRFRQYLWTWRGKDKSELDVYFIKGEKLFLNTSLQVEYDSVTEHGILRSVQVEWDNRIDSLLNAYEQFSNPAVNVYLPRWQ